MMAQKKRQEHRRRGIKLLARYRRAALKLLDDPFFARIEVAEQDAIDSIGSDNVVMGVRGRGNRRRYFRFNADPLACNDDNAARQQLLFTLSSIDMAAQYYLEARHTGGPVDDLVFRCISIGAGAAQAGLIVNNPTYNKGRNTLIRAALMRKSKSEGAAEKRRQKREEAEAAIGWARKAFPTAAHDDYFGFLKDKAAEHLEISRDTLDRRLAYKI